MYFINYMELIFVLVRNLLFEFAFPGKKTKNGVGERCGHFTDKFGLGFRVGWNIDWCVGCPFIRSFFDHSFGNNSHEGRVLDFVWFGEWLF